MLYICNKQGLFSQKNKPSLKHLFFKILKVLKNQEKPIMFYYVLTTNVKKNKIIFTNSNFCAQFENAPLSTFDACVCGKVCDLEVFFVCCVVTHVSDSSQF